MLVLSRKVGERIVIDGNINVVVNRVSGNRISLGVTAPRSVRVVRGEISDREASDEVTELSEAEAELPGESVTIPSALGCQTMPLIHRTR